MTAPRGYDWLGVDVWVPDEPGAYMFGWVAVASPDDPPVAYLTPHDARLLARHLNALAGYADEIDPPASPVSRPPCNCEATP